MDEKSTREFLSQHASVVPFEVFAERILRNRSDEERAAFEAFAAEQANAALNKNRRVRKNKKCPDAGCGLTPKEIDNLLDLLEGAQEREYDYFKTTRFLTGIIIGIVEGNYDIRLDMLKHICELHISTNIILEQLRDLFEDSAE